MDSRKDSWKKVAWLTLAGGLAFWLANFAISRTTIAAEYRAALSISYYPMLLEALIGGLIIGLLISFLLLRFIKTIAGKDPIQKSIFLTMILLVLTTFSIGGPASFSRTGNIIRFFTIGTIFNLVRYLALGFAIGLACKSKGNALIQNENNLLEYRRNE